jgi:hypothetical protein
MVSLTRRINKMRQAARETIRADAQVALGFGDVRHAGHRRAQRDATAC